MADSENPGEGRPVMSEYEQQRRAVQRELSGARRAQLFVRLAVMVLLVVGGYAAAGYFAFVRLPDEIARLERRLARDEASRTLLSELKVKSGLATAGQDMAKQSAALKRLLGTPEFAELDGNPKAVADIVRHLTESEKRLQTLQKQILQQENRVKMLDREFEGRVGKGSAPWQKKMAQAKAELERLQAERHEAKEKHDAARTSARTRIKSLEPSAASPEAGAVSDQERLDRLRAWRDRLTVWPLPRLKGLFER